jgi:hypothetical protein
MSVDEFAAQVNKMSGVFLEAVANSSGGVPDESQEIVTA